MKHVDAEPLAQRRAHDTRAETTLRAIEANFSTSGAAKSVILTGSSSLGSNSPQVVRIVLKSVRDSQCINLP